MAGALRLNQTEQAHLILLARPTSRAPWKRESVPEAIRFAVDSLDQPAYITGRRWDILVWNAAAAKVFPDFDGASAQERNLLLYMFTHPAARRLFAEAWE